MAHITLTKSKKGILFTLVFFFLLLSFFSLFVLLKAQYTLQSQHNQDLVFATKAKMIVDDLSSSYKDVLGITSLSYVGNDTHQTFLMQGNVEVRDYITQIGNLLDLYETGLLVDLSGISVAHSVSTDDLFIEPFGAAFFLNTQELLIGGSDTTTLDALEINLTFQGEISSVTDAFTDDGSGTIVTIRLIDNTSTTYSYTHTLDPAAINQQIEFDDTLGQQLTFRFGTSIYGDGLLNADDDLTSSYNITGLKLTYSAPLTPASGLFSNSSISFSILNVGFDGNIPLIRG